MTDVIQVSTTAPTRPSAEHLLRSAVRAKLAASGRMTGPHESAYWHEGEFGTGEEWLVILNTSFSLFDELEEHLVAEHEWTKPEIIAVKVKVEAGLRPFLDWVKATAERRQQDHLELPADPGHLA